MKKHEASYSATANMIEPTPIKAEPNANVRLALSIKAVTDLTRSGLNEITIRQSQFRMTTVEDFASSHKQLAEEGLLSGYLIPYFDLKGKVFNGFRRIKLIPAYKDKDKEIRYIQQSAGLGHAYVPPTIPRGYWDKAPATAPIIITEGEKKALAATQFGFPTIAFGGVDNWHNRTYRFDPEDLTRDKSGKVIVKIKSHTDAELLEEQVVPELLEVNWNHRQVYICYDSDQKPTTTENVSRAAFELAMWLESMGAHVSYIRLPFLPKHTIKIGLDDYLTSPDVDGGGPANFVSLLEASYNDFPQHPDVRHWIQKLLTNAPKRDDYLRVSRAVLADLDANGQRYQDDRHKYYYFDQNSKVLHEFRWDSNELRQLRLSSIGTLLYTAYGLGTSDTTCVSRIADSFPSVSPIHDVTPHRIVTNRGKQAGAGTDAVYYQLDDARMVKVSAGGIDLCDNGVDEVLFLSGQVVPIDEEDLEQEITTQINAESTPENFWLDAFKSLLLKPMPGLSLEQTECLLTCLFHMSPYLHRWRGLMLPLEMAVAEPNSGKTFLYNLRRGILTGRPTLDNPPRDIKDWYAAIGDAPAMWVCDNLGELPRDIKDTISDELARMLTDPDPSFSLRELYTTADIARVRVDCTFAMTSISVPFMKADIMQRSIVFELLEIPPGQRIGDWYIDRMERRPAWLAQELLVLHKFFQLVDQKWVPSYKSNHRLVHFEQALRLISEAIGFPSELIEGVIAGLTESIATRVRRSDPTMQSLQVFASQWVEQHPNVKDILRMGDIVEWAMEDITTGFSKLRPLQSTILLGRYFSMFSNQIARTTGMSVSIKHNQSYIKVDRDILKAIELGDLGVSQDSE